MVRGEGILSDGDFVSLQERFDGVLKELALEERLTLVEEKFVH